MESFYKGTRAAILHSLNQVEGGEGKCIAESGIFWKFLLVNLPYMAYIFAVKCNIAIF